MKPLTPKQQRFVDEYLVDCNATQAAIRAGFAPKNADVQGSQLLGKTWVASAIAQAMERRAKKVELTQKYVLERLMKESERLGKDASHAARVSALGLLGKHLGMFIDKHEIKETTERTPEEILASARRHLLRGGRN